MKYLVVAILTSLSLQLTHSLSPSLSPPVKPPDTILISLLNEDPYFYLPSNTLTTTSGNASGVTKPRKSNSYAGVFNEILQLCMNLTDTNILILNETVKANILQNYTYLSTYLKEQNINVSATDVILGPLSSYSEKKNDDNEEDVMQLANKKIYELNFTTVLTVAPELLLVVISRSNLHLIRKLEIAVKNSWPLIIVALLLTINVGTVVYFLEHISGNKCFEEEYITSGLVNGIWWSFVTMSTVGYGDKVPRSNFGRLLTVAWIWISLILVSSITSTIVAGISMTGSEFERKTILVRTKSIESEFAKHMYDTNVQELSNYSTVMKEITNAIDTIAIVDSVYAHNIQKTYQKTHAVIEEIKWDYDWRFGILQNNRSNHSESLTKCFSINNKMSIRSIISKYSVPVVTKNIVFTDDESFFMILCIIAIPGCLFLGLGIIIDILRYIFQKKNSKQATEKSDPNQNTLSMKSKNCHLHLKQRLLAFREEINGNITELENLVAHASGASTMDYDAK